MNGYKTVITGILSILSGLALTLGIELSPELLDKLKDNLEILVAVIPTLYGVLMIILRKFTNGPIGGSNEKS